MPKMKTKSGAKKRFRLTASGKVRGSAAFLSHNLRRRPQKIGRHTSELQSHHDLVCRLLLEKKNQPPPPPPHLQRLPTSTVPSFYSTRT